MKICPNFHTQLVSYQLQNPFLSNVSFLPPLKTENQRFYVFRRRVKKLKPERNGLKSNKFPYFTKGLILVSVISFRKKEKEFPISQKHFRKQRVSNKFLGELF